MSRLVEVTLPDIGDFESVDIIEVMVSPGKSVEADDSIITLESDKATMEIPSPYAGVVRQVGVKVGDRISKGGAIMTMELAEGESVDAPPSQALRLSHRRLKALRTCRSKCWCSVQGREATRRRFGRRISARKWR